MIEVIGLKRFTEVLRFQRLLAFCCLVNQNSHLFFICVMVRQVWLCFLLPCSLLLCSVSPGWFEFVSLILLGSYVCVCSTSSCFFKFRCCIGLALLLPCFSTVTFVWFVLLRWACCRGCSGLGSVPTPCRQKCCRWCQFCPDQCGKVPEKHNSFLSFSFIHSFYSGIFRL